MILQLLIISVFWNPDSALSQPSMEGSVDSERSVDTCGRISCGVNAICAKNQRTCNCLIGYEGDPFVRCNPKSEQSLSKTELDEVSKRPVVQSNISEPSTEVQAIQSSKITSSPSQATGVIQQSVKLTSSRTSCHEAPCGANTDCSDEGNGAVCKCHSGYEGDPFVRCEINYCHNNLCGGNADCSSSGRTAVCKCRAGYIGDPLSMCFVKINKEDVCASCGINAECSNGVCECISGYIGDPYSKCHMDPCSPVLGNPCGKNGECYSVHKGISAACKCLSGFPFGNPYRQCWSDPCNPSPCGRNTECISSTKANAFACRCKEGHFGNPHTECIANPCQPSPCGSNSICLHNGKAAICKCPKDSTGDPYMSCSSKLRQPRANPCATGVCGKGAECTIVRSRPVCHCFPGWQGDPYKECLRIQCSDNNDCGYKEACYNYQCIDPCREPCGIGAECFVRKHAALCRCPEGTTGDAFIHCRKFSRAEICAPCGVNTDCRVTVGNQPKCICKPTYFGNPLTGCQRECESDGACRTTQRCDQQTFRCVDLCQHGACGNGAICVATNHQETCSCPADFLGDPYFRCYAECREAADCSVDQECIRLKCKNVCHAESCGTGAKCKGTGHQALCFCPLNFTGNPKVLCKKIEIKDPCVPNPCGEAAVCDKKVLFGKESVSCSCPIGFFGDPHEKCIKGECAKDGDCPDDKACFTDHYCKSPCSPSRYPCGRDADCHTTNHHGAICSCPARHVGDPLVACRRQRG